jgi:hypothetical protein
VLAVEHDPVGLEPLCGELGKRPACGPPLRLGHADEVAFLVRRVPDADAARPTAHAAGRDLTLLGGQQLRVAHARQVLVARYDRRDCDRTRPRPAPDLVDSDHDPVARRPAFPLDPQRRVRRDHSR